MLKQLALYFVSFLIFIGMLYFIVLIWYIALPFILALFIFGWIRTRQIRKMWKNLADAQKKPTRTKKLGDENIIDVDYEEIK